MTRKTGNIFTFHKAKQESFADATLEAWFALEGTSGESQIGLILTGTKPVNKVECESTA